MSTTATTAAEAWLLKPAHAMAEAVRQGEVSAEDLTRASLSRVDRTEPAVNAFTDVTTARAIATAQDLDRRLQLGDAATRALPLLGVPYAVKNLFDVQGLTTLAGSKIERGQPPAAQDGPLVQRMDAAGAVLVGALNMDEYAYGFTTENSHEGPTHNPHDLTRVAGGSSGGSGAAVAAGQVPITLGSDTNGSIRVPSSLCGIFGLKPTYGRLPRNGSYPFVASLDHLGPFARSARDLALSYDAMQGHDAADPGCVPRAVEPVASTLAQGLEGLRIARLGEALGGLRTVTLPEADRARAAAFVISNAEGATLHLPDLRTRPQDFEPLSRDRFLAGALLPAAWVLQAQRVRRWFALRAAALFREVDVVIAPATPVVAPEIGTEWIEIEGRRLPARPSLGLLTQPISCIGLPVCAVPVWGVHGHMPIGLQVIAAPWREDLVLRVAHALETAGTCTAPVAKGLQ